MSSTGDTSQYQQIAPRPLPTAEEEGPALAGVAAVWKKKASTACLACKKAKRKVSLSNLCRIGIGRWRLMRIMFWHPTLRQLPRLPHPMCL